MNPIERMQAELSARFPDLSMEVGHPELDTGFWDMDISRSGTFLMSINWREKDGFSFSTPKPDDLYGPHDPGISPTTTRPSPGSPTCSKPGARPSLP